ncbi:hypothetical protein ACFFX1_17990 [Dactylosporangium sucinum]|uniref:Lipoprotein n=1 Tax=Dactylosporangium sucinum TaxID=1424081 RepID=A0A917TVX7_9ACTN|nr:hypothetical protein [Dactylosporangium sucinum]GGM40673.1 hypothetical protein GCM10007977_047600 [Dactylosporangium sucinum]
MKHITVLLTLVLAAGSVAACDAEFTAGSPAQARPVGAAASDVPPAEALRAAVQALDATSHNFELNAGTSTGSGRVDHAAKAATMEMRGQAEDLEISMAFTVIAPDVWVKADFGAELNELWGLKPGSWMRLDKTKLGASTTLPIDPSGTPDLGVTDLFKDGLADVRRTDATHFSGTVDITVTDSVLTPSDKVLEKAGDKAKQLPFTATVDDKGRLTSFVVDGASVDPDLAISLTFAGFGSVLPVSAPAGAVPAPDALYQMLS